MHLAPRPSRTPAPRYSAVWRRATSRLHLHARIFTRNSFASRKHRKPNKTNDGVHFYPVQMSRLATHPHPFQEFLIATLVIRNHIYLSENKGRP